MGESSIEWTDVTDNVIVAIDADGNQRGWWCSKISPGCAHCYSETINQSDYFKGNHLPYSGEPPTLKLREDIIDGWARQTKPKKHFVMSMSDIFGEWVPQSWIFRILDGMRAAPKQTFQVLTKRADVMLREVAAWLNERGLSEVPPTIWLGVSVENQTFAEERIPLLLDIPVAVRFLSVEPLLGPVNLKHIALTPSVFLNGLTGGGSIPHIAWVIVGAESGKKSRPCYVGWVAAVLAQCAAAGVPCFVKQLGGNVADRNDAGFEGDLETWVDGPNAGQWTNPSAWPHQHAAEDRIEHLTSTNYQGEAVRIHLRDRKGGTMDEWPLALRVRQFPAEVHS